MSDFNCIYMYALQVSTTDPPTACSVTGDDGGRALAEMLKKNQVLKKLLLSSNLLGDGGVLYLGDALVVNTGLNMLLLADNPFGDEGGWKLADVLCKSNRSLQVLDIHGTRMSRQTEREVCACSRHARLLLLCSVCVCVFVFGMWSTYGEKLDPNVKINAKGRQQMLFNPTTYWYT